MDTKDKSLFQDFGEKVKHHRKKKNLTQLDLAVEVGVSHEWICKIEKGKANVVSLALMRKIAQSLDMPFSLTMIDNVPK